MTRSILAVITAATVVTVISAQGCKQTGVGDPWIPELEYDKRFNAFTLGDVYLESKSFQCQTRLCLVNHFRGRLTCPYGQNSMGGAPAGAGAPCNLPGGNCAADPSQCVKGTSIDAAGNPNPNGSAEVPSQCANHRSDIAVYCSCRCANDAGKQNDGANYCNCPEGYKCSQLVTRTGLGNEGLTGAYCVKATDTFDPSSSGCEPCEAGQANCGKVP